jgi:hypothetical protein
MTLGRSLQKLTLTAHVAFAVGWLGAVTAFIPLALTARGSDDPATVQGAYVVMEVIGWYALLPLAFGALLTGLIQALGTRWGLFRHYWVLFKFVIAVLATIILLAYMQTLGYLASEAVDTAAAGVVSPALRSYTALVHACLALLALLAATVLSVYKPTGLTPYGWRKLKGRERMTSEGEAQRRLVAGMPRWVRGTLIVAVVLVVVLLVLLHIAGGEHGPARHAVPDGG